MLEVDCNRNGQADLDDLAVMPELDIWPDNDFIDCCEPCDLDYNQSGTVDQDDTNYQIDIVAGGANPTGANADFNRDGIVDQDDVNAFVDAIAGGPCPF